MVDGIDLGGLEEKSWVVHLVVERNKVTTPEDSRQGVPATQDKIRDGESVNCRANEGARVWGVLIDILMSSYIFAQYLLAGGI